MNFLRDQDIYMLIGSPNTTGVTKLLDQISQSLHSQYRSQNKDLFTKDGTINREGFMRILENMWRNWAQPSAIINAGNVLEYQLMDLILSGCRRINLLVLNPSMRKKR